MKFVAFVVLMMATAALILYSGLALPMTVSLVILILAVCMDFLTTWLCLKAGRREGNPLMAIAFRKIGVLPSFGILAVLWVIIILTRFIPAVAGVQTALALVYWLLPINNAIVYIRSCKRVSV